MDAESGEVLNNHVAAEGFHLVQINDSTAAVADSGKAGVRTRAGILDERLQMSGFDGLGSSQESYASAEVSPLACPSFLSPKVT